MPLTVDDPGPTSRVSLVTYNVQGDPAGEELRISRLLRVIEAERPEVVLLQEVAPWALRVIAADRWVRTSGYAATSLDGQTAAPGGLLVLSRFPIEETRHLGLEDEPSPGGLVTTLRINGLPVGVGNVHFSSPLADGPRRAQELDRMFEVLAPFEQAILAGDFNFGDGEEPETSHLDPGFRDVWSVLHPGEPGYTWDMEQSPQARRRAYEGEHSRRLDRILLRSRPWRPEEARVIGNEPTRILVGAPFPSDHFGLAVTASTEPPVTHQPLRDPERGGERGPWRETQGGSSTPGDGRVDQEDRRAGGARSSGVIPGAAFQEELMSCVDGFVIPVPKKKLAAYRRVFAPFFLLAFGCVSVIETAPDPELITDAERVCSTDDDCTRVPAGCCSCNAGGSATAISTASSSLVGSRRSEKCAEIGCPQYISTDESCDAEPACVELRCELVN